MMSVMIRELTIGERAAKAIREQAKKKGHSIYQECINLGCARSYNSWDKGECEPSAYFLQRMLYAGYDILWILGGEKWIERAGI